MQHFKKLVFISFIGLVLSACTSIPLTSLWKLRNADPLESDPAFFKLAVITNKLIQLKDDSTSIGLELNTDNPDYDFKTTVKASVQANAFEDQLAPLKNDKERITLFSINEEAARQLRMAQSRIRSTKEKGIQGSASLNVTVDTGCIDGPKPATLIANIYISLEPTQGFIKLMSNIDLLEGNQDFLVACD